MPHTRGTRATSAKKGVAKLKMSNTKFRVLLILPLVIVALVAVLVTLAGTTLGSTLDTYLGKGDTYVETPSNKTSWDSNYYSAQVAQGDE